MLIMTGQILGMIKQKVPLPGYDVEPQTMRAIKQTSLSQGACLKLLPMYSLRDVHENRPYSKVFRRALDGS